VSVSVAIHVHILNGFKKIITAKLKHEREHEREHEHEHEHEHEREHEH
jgi:ABC-type Zn2+ transport system substrate-binding protein/surface adhesin